MNFLYSSKSHFNLANLVNPIQSHKCISYRLQSATGDTLLKIDNEVGLIFAY